MGWSSITFLSRRYKNFTDISGDQLCLSCVKAHGSDGMRERLSEPPHLTNRIRLHKTRSYYHKYYSFTSCGACHGWKKGIIRLVPSNLVFGILLRLSIIVKDLCSQKGTMKALGTAQAKMYRSVAKREISTALKRDLPQLVSVKYKVLE